MDQWFDRYATTHEQSTDALGGIDLVAGDREQIDAKVRHVGRDFANGLSGIGVEQTAKLVSYFGDSLIGWMVPVCYWRA